MTTQTFWAPIIPALWRNLALVFLAAAALGAQTLDPLTRAYRERPTQPNRARLVQYIAANPKTQNAALAQLALAFVDLDNGNAAAALANFNAAGAKLPKITDYANFGAARALVALNRKPEAIRTLDSVAAQGSPVSPQRPWALVMAGNLLIEANEPGRAVTLLGGYRKDLPSPQGVYTFGAALDAAGRANEAAAELRSVYYGFPKSDEAAKAEPLLARYPAPPAALILDRAKKLMESGEARRAARELEAAIQTLDGADRDLARIRHAATHYFLKDYATALSALQALHVAPGEPDAERLLHIVNSARRLDRYKDVDAAIGDLARLYPRSPWRLEAILGAVIRFLIANQPEGYEPLYRACYADFPASRDAPQCHWKVAWLHYIRRQPDVVALLREQIENYPSSEDAPAALYFLGRLSEQTKDPASAKAYYEAATVRFPNFYYAVVSRERLATLNRVKSAGPVATWLAAAGLPQAGAGADFQPDDITRLRLERARLLATAGIDDWAELELKYGARNGAKSALMAIELSRIAARRGANDLSLRYIKAYAPGYLGWNIEQAPIAFWRLAFPMPYKSALEKYSASNSIDPYIVAGLIRQESEFDPKAVSRSKAIGLTQILPNVGRELSRRIGMPRFSTAMLYQPDTNLRLGTFYLRRILDSLQGRWFATLAAYNAGPSRAKTWLTWFEFREPSEFIESIPFHETRNYVQVVLRNADLYRRIYTTTTQPARAAARESQRPSSVSQ